MVQPAPRKLVLYSDNDAAKEFNGKYLLMKVVLPIRKGQVNFLETTRVLETLKTMSQDIKEMLQRLKLIFPAHTSLEEFLQRNRQGLMADMVLDELPTEPEVMVQLCCLELDVNDPETAAGAYKIAYNILWDTASFTTNFTLKTKRFKY